MDDINLAIVSGKRIIQAENLTRNPEQPVSVKAIKDARYVLAQGASLTAPDMISIKRVGNDLHLILPGENSEKPNLIIEDYYPQRGEIIGLGEEGQWHSFTAVSADRTQDPQALQDGEQSTAALDSTTLPPLDNLEVDSNALAFGLIAVGAAAAVAALAALISSNSGSDNSSPPPPPEDTPEEAAVNPETPPEKAEVEPEASSEVSPAPVAASAAIDSILDDLGEHGDVMANDITDDTTPTLNGSGQQAGSVIEIRDNGTFLGTAIANSEGNWSFTPVTPLPDGIHEFVVIATDPAGVVSAPSDPAVIVIASSSEPVEVFSLSDLLPPDTDLGEWANISACDFAGLEHHTLDPTNDASRVLDELLNSSHPLN